MEKPTCQLSGTDGNVFSIIASVRRVLKEEGQKNKADEFRDKALKCSSYGKVLQLCNDYVEVY